MAIRAPHAASARPAPTRIGLRPVYYPESDGKPMAETETHGRAMIDALYKLDVHYQDRPDVYVASNNLLYYEEGNPRRAVAPDVYVVLGAHKHLRRVYLLWEEGLAPSFVLEVSSRSTRRVDLGSKRDLYARLGVGEYVLFDPLGEYLNPRLAGFRLVGGAYAPIEPQPDGVVRSHILGLDLSAGDLAVEFVDPVTGERYRSAYAERDARASAEDARASAEAARAFAEAARASAEAARHAERAAFEAEIARLRAELARRDSTAG